MVIDCGRPTREKSSEQNLGDEKPCYNIHLFDKIMRLS